MGKGLWSVVDNKLHVLTVIQTQSSTDDGIGPIKAPKQRLGNYTGEHLWQKEQDTQPGKS